MIKTFSIYLEVEALMDFRYGKLLTACKDIDTEMILKFGNYRERTSDRFEEMFTNFDKEAYNKQPINAEVLKKSPATGITRLAGKMFRSFLSHPSIEKARLKICINFKNYPYSETAKNKICSLVGASLPDNWAVSVSHISRSDADITAKYLRSKYDVACIYNLDEFIAYHKPKSKEMFRGLAFYSFINLYSVSMDEFMCRYDALGDNDVDPALMLTEHLSWIIEAYFDPLATATTEQLAVL